MRGTGGDYQRAKRLRKLSKLLSSPKAQKTVRTLKWYTLAHVMDESPVLPVSSPPPCMSTVSCAYRVSVAICCLLLGVHALFFSLTIKGIASYNVFFGDVVNAGTTVISTSKASDGCTFSSCDQ